MALAPLLNHSSFEDPGEEICDEEKEDTVQVETYLGTQRRRIAVSVTSYQNARNHLSKGSPIHGFILVYDTQLKSSFSIMKVSRLSRGFRDRKMPPPCFDGRRVRTRFVAYFNQSQWQCNFEEVLQSIRNRFGFVVLQ